MGVQSILIFIFASFAIISACPPPTLPPGSTWVPSPNCSGAYTANGRRCHCWGHCGYICEPLSPTTTTTRPASAPNTCRPSNANGPAQRSPSQTWVSNPGCTLLGGPGNTVCASTTPTRFCRCYAYCGYLCDSAIPCTPS